MIKIHKYLIVALIGYFSLIAFGSWAYAQTGYGTVEDWNGQTTETDMKAIWRVYDIDDVTDTSSGYNSQTRVGVILTGYFFWGIRGPHKLYCGRPGDLRS